MSVQELEEAVAALPPEELSRFSAWFDEYRADRWDEQIEADLESGRLDELIQEARDDIAAGRTQPL